VSALVRRFEINLGIMLFHRTTRSVEPTKVCEELLSDVRAALGLIEEALARACVAEDRPPPLRLAFRRERRADLLLSRRRDGSTFWRR
jgi:DNA-binding transcriptional LysR family regulator